MLSLFSPSFQVRQVTVADKMPVEDVKVLGDKCYMNRKCFYMQNTGEWLSQKSSYTRQRIDETVSFPFSWSPAKKFLSHLRRMESTGGLSPFEDCRAKVSTDLNTTTTRGIDHSVSAAANESPASWHTCSFPQSLGNTVQAFTFEMPSSHRINS